MKQSQSELDQKFIDIQATICYLWDFISFNHFLASLVYEKRKNTCSYSVGGSVSFQRAVTPLEHLGLWEPSQSYAFKLGTSTKRQKILKCRVINL